MSHPDPLFDPHNSYEDDDMFDENYDDYNDFYDDTDHNDSMDGDFDSAMASAGHGTDEDYGYYGDPEDDNDYGYRENFHGDDGYGYDDVE